MDCRFHLYGGGRNLGGVGVMPFANDPKLTVTVGIDGVTIDAWGRDGLMTWQGFYEWGMYGSEMPARVLRDLPEWILNNAPEWVAQWETAGAQA